MEFKFLKLRDLQGKTPSFPAAGEVHIIYVPEPDDSNLHKAGAGRAMIREILSYYLCIDKGLVCLHESRHGKPYLASPAIGRNLYFNISHTEGYLAFAMSTSTPLGIDIEKVDRNVRLQSLMGRFFHAEEIKKFLDEYGPRCDTGILSVHFIQNSENKFHCIDFSPEDLAAGVKELLDDPQEIYHQYLMLHKFVV